MAKRALNGKLRLITEHEKDATLLIANEQYPVRVIRAGRLIVEIELEATALLLASLSALMNSTEQHLVLIMSESADPATRPVRANYQLQSCRRRAVNHLGLILRRC